MVLRARQAHGTSATPCERRRFQADQPSRRSGAAANPGTPSLHEGALCLGWLSPEGRSYKRHARFAGKTKWSYWKLWNLAIEGITSFTIIALKLATYLGFLIATIAFVYGLVMIFKVIVFGEDVRGFPTLLSVMLLLGGVPTDRSWLYRRVSRAHLR